MSLAGPRIDRPSAIGDEGRPRTASLWIATAVVVSLVGAGGVAMGEPSLLPTLATVGGVAAAGMGLSDRERFVPLFVGQLLFVAFGSALVTFVIVAPVVLESGLAVSGFAVALFGIAIAWADVGTADGVERAVSGAVLSYLATLFSLAGLVLLAFVGFVAWTVLAGLTALSTPAAALVGFLVVVACSSAVVSLSLRWLPIEQLTPRTRRPVVRERLAAVRRLATVTTLCCLGGTVVAVVLWTNGAFGAFRTARPGLAAPLATLASPWILGPVVAVAAAGLLASLLAWVARALTRRVDAASVRRLAAGLAGGVFAVAIAVGPLSVLAGSPVGVYVSALLLLGPVLLGLGLGVCLVGMTVGLVPDRAGGPTVAAAGLVAATVGVGSGSPALAFACAAGAVLVWDVSTFGLGVTAELGHLPETRRLELFHAVLSVGVGAGAVGLAVGLERLRTATLAGPGDATALLAVSLGAVFLLVALRG